MAQINSHQSLTNSARMMHLFGAVYGTDAARTAEHYACVRADPGAHRALADAVEMQRPHFDSFNLQMGYCYGAHVDPDTLDISLYEPSFQPGNHLPLVKLTDGPWLLGRLPHHAFALVTGPDGGSWRCGDLPVLVEGVDFAPLQPFHEQARLTASGALLLRPDGHICARWEAAPTDPEAAVRNTLTNVLAGTLPGASTEH